MRYLSDEELEKMIAEIEESDMVPAPTMMKDEILSKLTPKTSDIHKIKSFTKKDYLKYCIQVSVAIAATIALMIFVPVKDLKPSQGGDKIFTAIGQSRLIDLSSSYVSNFLGGLSNEKR